MSSEDKVLKDFRQILSNYKFQHSDRYDEQFAIERFLKKYEEPDRSATARLRSVCWDDFISFDNNLSFPRLPDGIWYKVRLLLHSALSKPERFEYLRYPKGSEFIPTRGRNSLESRLSRSKWTCTFDNFDRFAEVVYTTNALKKAFRRRYSKWERNQEIDRKSLNCELWDRFNGTKRPQLEIFKWKLERIVILTHGSRFSTVPKNNEKRRPINVEPFGNIIVQAGIGDFIRQVLLKDFGINLDQLQMVHRDKISDPKYATIDLKNASDSVSVDLCRFLFPSWFMNELMMARSGMVLGPDDFYYPLKKISSMGNGFTFELMTLILTGLCRVLSCDSSVYGDDIIIPKEFGRRLINALTNVGFVVNTTKSFLEGPFRESCGANYHDDFGYIESYDFLYPESIYDCVVTFNKVRRLSKKYNSFRGLHNSLYRSLPDVLRGGPSYTFDQAETLDLVGRGKWERNENEEQTLFPPFFVTDKFPPVSRRDDRVDDFVKQLCYEPNTFHKVYGFVFESSLASPTLRNLKLTRDWAKYLMYLHSNRVAKDVIEGEGKWIRITLMNNGNFNFRVKDAKRKLFVT